MLAELRAYINSDNAIVSERVKNEDLRQVVYKCPMLGTVLRSGQMEFICEDRTKFVCRNCGLVHVVDLNHPCPRRVVATA